MINAEKAREAWRDKIMENVVAGNFKAAFQLMASNVGDKGDLQDFVNGFCANADPWDGKKEVM